MTRVKSRKVTRYYALHRGFQTKQHAYQALAKVDLKMKVDRLSRQLMRADNVKVRGLPWDAVTVLYKAYDDKALAQLFPPECERSNAGINFPNLKHGQSRFTPRSYIYCQGCRWAWIVTRAKAMQREDEQGFQTQPDDVLALPAPNEQS